MPSAKDFRLGELVRFKAEKEQEEALFSSRVSSAYRNFFGHLCLVEALEDLTVRNYGDEQDLIIVRSIATGKTTICCVHRLEKYDG